MATATKVLVREAFPTTGQNLYSTPASTIAVVTNVVIVNTSSAAATFSLQFDELPAFSETPIPGKATISIDMKQVLDGSSTVSTIDGSASATSVKVHISGVEIA